MNAKIISAFLVLAFASLACGFNIDMPKVPSAGPEVTDEITVPIPDADEVSLRLSFGAGDLKLAPGAKKLVEGTATYNYAEFEPFVDVDEGNVHIHMGDEDFNGFPSFKNLKNKWDFKLGDTPMDLTIESGAYDGLAVFRSTTSPLRMVRQMWTWHSLNPTWSRCPPSAMRRGLLTSR